jgi:hypothetical protein
MSRKRLIITLALLVLIVAIVGAGIWFSQPSQEPPTQEAARAEPTNREEPMPSERPAPNFPVATDGAIVFTDSPYAGIDERSSYRTFEIAQPVGNKRFLTATYLDEPDWQDDRNDDEALIFRLADLNAAFSAAVSIDLPKSGTWEVIRLHIGDFAQDYCGDLSAVVSFRSPRVFAISHLGSNEIDFSASQCPLQLEDYVKDKKKYGKREEPDDFSAFCTVRRECLNTYYSKPENREHLSPAWLGDMARIELH